MNSPSRSSRGPLRRLLDLFSSVSLGIVLLALLFIYSTLGSAGLLYPTGDGWVHAQIRQWRPFEMTEFEWFHWWPFDLLIGLICLTIIVTTLRRIPFRPINYGVWMIHTGILTLCAGSFWYFSTKVEGDSPVLRRQVTVELPTGEVGRFPAVPGNSHVISTASGPWRFDISRVDPAWTIVSGDDAGKQTFSVTVSVQSPDQRFMRQLLADYPQYTEDILRTDDPAQPMKRAIKELGRPLVDTELVMTLDYSAQSWVYLANWVSKSWALYIREAGQAEWIQRPVYDLPFYNDYIGSFDDLWLEPGDTLPLDPLDLYVPATALGDPLPDTPLHISAYLRYAVMTERRVPGEHLDPAATVEIEGPTGSQTFELAAFDPTQRAVGDLLELRWAATDEERTRLSHPQRPRLTVAVPAVGFDEEIELLPALRGADFTSIPGTDYAYRIDFWQDGLQIQPGRAVSLANIRIRTPERSWQRWVTADPASIRDWETLPDNAEANPHGDREVPLDEGIEMRYTPGHAPATLTLIAGPEPDQLGLLALGGDDEAVMHDLAVGVPLALGENVKLTVRSFSARTELQTRPARVPMERRERDVRELRSMVKVDVPGATGSQSVWVPFHQYAFRDPNETLRRYPYRPARVRLDDGRVLELILSRQRIPLPSDVILDDFRLTTHVGGFSGRVSSILNWTSIVRFDDDGHWGPPVAVSVNEPAEHDGFWYFQAQWDPPARPRFEGDPPSAGLNFTVLGVGNRNGVGVQLMGCIIAVLGMLYAFYYKPVLRRRLRTRASVSAGDRS